MKFKNLEDLVKKINKDLGKFCPHFQYTRKRLLRKQRAAAKNRLFKFNSKNPRAWAINEGGGTEIQYHIYLNKEKRRIDYGIGFNSQYVPFKNGISPVEHIKPYIDSFLAQPNLRKELKSKDFEIIRGNEQLLHEPKIGEYVLFGKKHDLIEFDEFYEIKDASYQSMLNNLQNILFETYKSVIENMNQKNALSIIANEKIDVLRIKPQIILQGPPGTGKTYEAKNIAEQLIYGSISLEKEKQAERLSSTEQFKIVQFHPSYTYEDFVRGIMVRSNSKGVEYITEDKLLSEFAQTALTNFQDAKNSDGIAPKEQWISDALNKFIQKIQIENIDESEFILEFTPTIGIVEIKEDAFIYTGTRWNSLHRLTFKEIIVLYKENVKVRQDIIKSKKTSRSAKQHATYYLNFIEKFKQFIKSENIELTEFSDIIQKPFVLIIDEINRANLPSVLGELIYALEYRGEEVDSIYAVEDSRKIVLPPNLFIIGTMNTADRSVGHIDYAIRRRFAFIEMLPNDEIIKNVRAKNLFHEVEKLFTKDYLSADFDKDDVQLGHSYFLIDIEENDVELKKEREEKELSIRLEYEIKPILLEYLKDGIFTENAGKLIKNLTV